jgi:predicted RNA-binding Zn-ribbon protein involved in translation (DUF1610 family)
VENGIVHHENVINDLRLMREIGVQNWVNRQVNDHTCPKCGRLIYWKEANTHKCNDSQ